MEEDRMPKKDLHSKTGKNETKRTTQEKMKRRSGKRFQVLEVRRWRELVIDRDKWRGIVRQAKAHSGL
jgi:hypothetical protein